MLGCHSLVVTVGLLPVLRLPLAPGPPGRTAPPGACCSPMGARDHPHRHLPGAGWRSLGPCTDANRTLVPRRRCSRRVGRDQSPVPE